MPAGRRRARPAKPGASLFTPLFEPGIDRGAIERIALAWAVHADGAGFTRAHLLAWNGDREDLEGRLSWPALVEPRSLEETLVAARWLAIDASDPDGTRLIRALRFDAEELGPAIEKAWNASRTVELPPEIGPEPWSRAERIGVIPLRHGSRPHGLIVGEWERLPERAIERLETMRLLLNAALGAHATAELARERDVRTLALATFARTTVSSVNLAEATHAMVKLACEGAVARGAALWRLADDPARPHLEVAASYGPAAARDRLARELEGLATACLAEGRPRRIDRPAGEEGIPEDVAAQISSVCFVPLVAYGSPVGALIVYDRLGQHPCDGARFHDEDLTFLTALGDQYALATCLAASGDALRAGEEARRELIRRLAHNERLAALGEISARLAREARNPITSIAAFARRVHRNLEEDDPNRDYLEVVIREAERLEQTLANQLPTEKPAPPRFQVESVNALLQNVLRQAGEKLVRRRVRLLKRLATDVPTLLLDAHRMTAALTNLVDHALERVSSGGRVRIETRRVQQFVVVEIAHDGPADPGHLLDDLFVAFHLQGGAETGLAMARQIVLEHGGEVRARSAGEWSTIFLLSLPVRENADRRRTPSERRISRNDRRHRAPLA